MQILLGQVLSCTKSPEMEARAGQFYNNVCQILEVLNEGDLVILKAQVVDLIEKLPREIIDRPTKEVGSSDYDLLLNGLLNFLIRLLQRFPQFKKTVGAELTHYIVHDCLFEIPHGTKNAPKCKSLLNRAESFQLLRTLCTDCIENLVVVLDYLKLFN